MGIKRFILCIVCLALIFTCGCGKEDPYAGIPNPIATITLTDGRVMHFELYLREAPNTVANFVSLAQSGFYDGCMFYRVVPGVFIESGDPENSGYGDAGYTIEGEFEANGRKNSIKHRKGVISMARKKGYDTASSQFFIMSNSCEDYDGEYAAFGVAMDNFTLEVIDYIAGSAVDSHYVPIYNYVIESVTIDTKGYEYTPVIIESEEKENEED